MIISGRAAVRVYRMKTVTRSLLLIYSPISNDQLVELYCATAEVKAVTVIYSKSVAVHVLYNTWPKRDNIHL